MVLCKDITTIRFYDSELIVTTTSTTAETKSFYEVMTVAHITRGAGWGQSLSIHSSIARQIFIVSSLWEENCGQEKLAIYWRRNWPLSTSQVNNRKLQWPSSAHLGDIGVCLPGRSDLVLELFRKEMTVKSKFEKLIQVSLAWSQRKTFFPIGRTEYVKAPW